MEHSVCTIKALPTMKVKKKKLVFCEPSFAHINRQNDSERSSLKIVTLVNQRLWIIWHDLNHT